MANIVPYTPPGALTPQMQAAIGEYIQRMRMLGPYAAPGVTIDGALAMDQALTAGLGGGGAGNVPPPQAGPTASPQAPGPRASQAPNFTRRQERTGLGQQRPIGYSVRQPPGKPFLPSSWLGKAFALGAPAAAAYNTLGASPEEIAAQSAGTGNPFLDRTGAFATNLGSALTLGTVAPETFAATGRNAEALLSGATMEPFTNAGREQAAALEYLQSQIATTAEQIVGLESSGADAKQLRDRHSALIMLARGVEAGTVAPTDVMPGDAPQAPSKAPSMMAPSGAPGFGLSGPYVDYSFQPTQIPAYAGTPDYSAAAPEMAPEDPTALSAALMQGLVTGGLQTDPMASPASLLFNLGMGTLGGRAQHMLQGAEDKKAFTAEQNAFKRWLAEQQSSDAARKSQYELSAAGVRQGDTQLKLAADEKRAAQLQPKIEGGYAILPSRNGDKINYNLQALPDKNLGLWQQYGQFMISPDDTFQQIMSSPGGPDAIGKLASDLDLAVPAKLQAVGANDKTIGSAATAQLVAAFAAAYPAEFQQVQREAIIRRALTGAK